MIVKLLLYFCGEIMFALVPLMLFVLDAYCYVYLMPLMLCVPNAFNVWVYLMPLMVCVPNAFNIMCT